MADDMQAEERPASRLDEIRAALANGYDSCPELAKEDVALLLAVVEAAMGLYDASAIAEACRIEAVAAPTAQAQNVWLERRSAWAMLA